MHTYSQGDGPDRSMISYCLLRVTVPTWVTSARLPARESLDREETSINPPVDVAQLGRTSQPRP